MKKQSRPQKPTVNWLKKHQLMQQIILTNSSIAHNTYEYQKDALLRELEELQNSLRDKVQEIDKDVLEAVDKYRTQVQAVGDWYLNENQEKGVALQQSFTLDELKKYLNTEKWVLQQLLSMKQSEPNQMQRIHKLQKQTNFQELLQGIQIKQLERQINYLSTQVITGSGVIFVPENTVSEAEELQLTTKLQNMISEAERLINVEVDCGESKEQGVNQSRLIQAIQSQDKRLNKILEMLHEQEKSIQSLESKPQEYAKKLKQLPLFSTSRNSSQNLSNCQTSITSLDSLDTILNLKTEEFDNVISYEQCLCHQVSASLKQIRNKIKKIGQ